MKISHHATVILLKSRKKKKLFYWYKIKIIYLLCVAALSPGSERFRAVPKAQI